jgi:hypothetical protein
VPDALWDRGRTAPVSWTTLACLRFGRACSGWGASGSPSISAALASLAHHLLVDDRVAHRRPVEAEHGGGAAGQKRAAHPGAQLGPRLADASEEHAAGDEPQCSEHDRAPVARRDDAGPEPQTGRQHDDDEQRGQQLRREMHDRPYDPTRFARASVWVKGTHQKITLR